MHKKHLIIVLAGLATLSACASRTPEFDQHYGTTLTTLRAQQTANPEAPVQNQSKSVEGLDGRAARESLDRYYKTFREPPPAPPAVIIAPSGG